MRLIDARVAAGAVLEITTGPCVTWGGRHCEENVHVVTLRGVEIDGVQASPRCTAYSQQDAVLSIGRLLARWGFQ